MLDGQAMQLLLSLTEGNDRVFMRTAEEVDAILPSLHERGFVVFEIDGSRICSEEVTFREFAKVMRMPAGFYGAEEFAPNADAFDEYFDDVMDWVPAQGHVFLVRSAETLRSRSPANAELLARIGRSCGDENRNDARIVFVSDQAVRHA